MKAMAGCKEYRGDRDIKLKGFSSAKQFAEELNTFYLRFDDNDFKLKQDLPILKQNLACSQFFNISMIQVKGLFQRVNTKKSPGPDNIGGRVLRLDRAGESRMLPLHCWIICLVTWKGPRPMLDYLLISLLLLKLWSHICW